MDLLSLKKLACETIDKREEDLKKLSTEIWNHPELGLEEYFAHELLTTFLRNEGLEVRQKYPLETSFVAKYGEDQKDSLKIGICCEYDALPGIGHACGHNLIAEAAIAVALALKEVIKREDLKNFCLIIYGTPAEESGNGKIKMIQHGVFDEADICMMSHPFLLEMPEPEGSALVEMKFRFEGRSAHAAGAPWEGINALDAAVACYSSVSMLRQQMKPNCSFNMIFTEAGERTNIIPGTAELKFEVRSKNDDDLIDLKEKIKNYARGSAQVAGCKLSIEEDHEFVRALRCNKLMSSVYADNAKALGVQFSKIDINDIGSGSTDMANVCILKPGIHPMFKIKTTAHNHTKEFTKYAILDENQTPTLNSAKSLAMTAIDILCNPGLLKDIQKEHHETYGIK